MRCFIFDIDGTIADCSHRIRHITNTPKDWRTFFSLCHADSPISHIIELAQRLALSTAIVYVSGRSDECKNETREWLDRHKLPYGPIYMRRSGDHRDDDIVKVELLAQLRTDGYEPIMAFDDRDRVVATWRANGIPCAQVAPGNF